MSTTAATDFNTSGTIAYGWYDRVKRGVIRKRCSFSAAASVALPNLPANARVLQVQTNIKSALTYSTATRFGVGTSGFPCAYYISGTATTAGTNSSIRNDNIIPVFASCAASTAYAPAASSEATITLGAGAGGSTPSIPANFLKPGDIIRYRIQGITTAINATDTLTVRLKDGSNTMGATGAPQVAANDIFYLQVDQVIRTIGSSGTYVTGGSTFHGTAAAAAGAADIPSGTFLASTAIDTTAAFTPTISGQFSTNSATNSCRVDLFTVEIIRPILPVSSSTTSLVVTAVANTGVAAGTITSGDIDVEVFFEELAPIPTA